MKKIFNYMQVLSSLAFVLCSTNSFSAEPFRLNTPLTTEFQNVIQLVRENLNGWTKLSFDKTRTLWTPHSFYIEKKSNPREWVSQIKEMGFCEPSKTWKSFPVLAASNDQIMGSFEQIAMNPKLNVFTQLSYTETIILGGKARSISYDYNQNGPLVNITCSAGDERGDIQSIQQTFDITNPKHFDVQQKKNGKLLGI